MLKTAPGVGPLTAHATLATLPDPSLFKSGRDFAAWLGLTPRLHGTGGKTRTGRITKQAINRCGDCSCSAPPPG